MAKRKTKTSKVPASFPPVQQGLVSPRRNVPSSIARPPYAQTGDPGPSVLPLVRTQDEIKSMRKAGSIAAEVLLYVGEKVRPGITTDNLDQIAHDEIIRLGAYPSPLNYRGFPKSVCTSVNEVVCHGIPDSRQLLDGDIINIDVTVFYEGVHGDTSVTFLVGEVDDYSRQLVQTTRNALTKGMETVHNGSRVCDIGQAIEKYAHSSQLSVVREFIGHGVGPEFHSSLAIPHYFDRRATTELLTGMTFTIEPMLNLGGHSLRMWDDTWTVVTIDGRRSAQFEHTLVVTDDGYEILTQTASGTIPAEYFS
ncbi:MAG: type I methionyl aminopeptidase [Acidimicrobiaceae bacterium]|nr:type I methionyl aminopeptidase [Acidimicrobiaceae bacterium]|tara:strand:- start:605 stop:1528 length:924 start_codon:yes stop_codon:yes gene_type:complete